ncbi:hypothetical protein Cgig2_001064 [Carnegiea gigantea]|uniref:Uncharacterized protein n=1 Tax=Carnegiea gigantea TaxID=171969 RepID=A0A9Q1K2E7_9CARY|nr:hypothetical protein Cgig2_001064 [Carnegiea gigantea]
MQQYIFVMRFVSCSYSLGSSEPPGSSPSPATTVGPRLCRRQTTVAGHQCATQKPPRHVLAPTSFLPLLCVGRTGRELSKWPVKFKVPGVVIGGFPEVRWTLGLREPPAAPSPVVVFGFDGLPLGFLKICVSKEGVGICRSRCWVCQKFLSPLASSVAVSGRRRTFWPPKSRRNFSNPSFPARILLFCFDLWRCCGFRPATGKFVSCSYSLGSRIVLLIVKVHKPWSWIYKHHNNNNNNNNNNDNSNNNTNTATTTNTKIC